MCSCEFCDCMEDINIDLIISDRDNIVDYCIDKFATEDSISIYCNYELACKLQRAVCDFKFDSIIIKLTPDIDEYICTIVTYEDNEKYLCIDGARIDSGDKKGRLYEHEEFNYTIITLDNVEEIFEWLFCDNILVMSEE